MQSALVVIFAALVGSFEGPAQIACVALLVVLLAGEGRRALKPGLPELAILVWMLAGIPGTLDQESRNTSEGALRPLLALAYLAGRGALARADDRTLSRAALAFALACVVNGAYGLVQVFWFDPPLESLLAGRLRSQHLVDPEHPERLRMATGLFYNRLKLAHTGVLGLGLIALCAMRGPPRVRRWLAHGAAIVVLGAAILLTYRRAAPGALIVASLFLGAVLKRVRLVAVTSAIGAGILALYAATELGRSRANEADAALAERLEIYRAAAAMIRDHPLIGVGHGDYKGAIAGYARDIPEVLWTSPHNWPLHVLAETGLLGAIAFFAAIGLVFVPLVRRVRADRTSLDVHAFADRFSLLGLTTLLGLGAVHSVLYHAPVALLFWTLLGLARGLERLPVTARAASNQRA